jgi:putative toxin-antitoxin system antitoxin component (TIGR02293 family)
MRTQAPNADLAVVGAVRAGLPVTALDRLIADKTITEQKVEVRFIPRRRKGTLSPEQSDLVARLARIQAAAEEVFGDRSEARRWLRETNGRLGGQPLLALLDTEEGGRCVESVLGRIAHGIVE